MNIEVMYFGQLRELTEVPDEIVSAKEGSSLADLVRQVAGLHGDAFQEKLDGIRGLRILINGREYTQLDGMGTVLKDKDAVVFLPPITGG
jgi:MoaD family protein